MISKETRSVKKEEGKGFKKPPSEVQAVLMETLQVAFSVLEALPGVAEVRNKMYVFIQRLIQCLGENVLSIMPRILLLLIQNCTSEDILDVSQLMNQLCIKFGAKALSSLDTNILPFLQKCHHLSNTIAADKNMSSGQQHDPNAPIAPHLRTEQLSIQKLSFAVMNHIVTNGVTAVLLSPTNVSSLEAILQSMSDGAINVEDPLMKKTCLIFFRLLLDQWVGTTSDGNNNGSSGGAPDFVVHGYVTFVCNILIPGMMQFFLRADGPFNVNDANYHRLLVELSRILEIIKHRLPESLSRIAIQMQLPQPIAEGFCSAANRKEFEEFLKSWIQKNQEQNYSATR